MPAAPGQPRRRYPPPSASIPDDHIEDVERAIVDGPHLPKARWGATAALLEISTSADQKQAAKLREALTSSGATQVDDYLAVFLTDGEPRKSLVTKKFADANPAVARRGAFEQESLRLGPLIERRRAVTTRDRSEALLYIATAAAANYRREKQERGLLDFDDLIDKTLAMLDGGASGWVHYKLDRGVDHVLIDEAQDTSPRQWDIVAHIISEFTSGAGARDGVVRTVFAVGDEKQSIFSFQGAEPREFADRRQHLQTKFKAAGLKFDPISFTYSFRSGASVLHAVESAFQAQNIYQSITSDATACLRTRRLMTPSEPDRSLGIAVARRPAGSRRLARAVRRGVRDQPRGQARQTHPGRDQVAGRERHHDRQPRPPASAALRRHAGAGAAARQRLRCRDPGAEACRRPGRRRRPAQAHRAYRDHRPDELADALLLPQDDLALAVALKSPLFGLDDDDLLALAWQRKGTLRQALSQHAPESEKIKNALRRLEACERRFTIETPFAFYAWLLGGDGGRARILKRLGHEATDALDEFLDSRSATSARRRPRCRVSWPGCARPTPR